MFGVGLGVSNTAGSGDGSYAGSRFFSANIFPLKLLRISSLVLISNPAFFKKDIASTGILRLSISLASFNGTSCISLGKQ